MSVSVTFLGGLGEIGANMFFSDQFEGFARYDIVAHSLGGLITRRMIADGQYEGLRRVVLSRRRAYSRRFVFSHLAGVVSKTA